MQAGQQGIWDEVKITDLKEVRKSEEIVAHPQRHLAVFSQQGHIKDEAAQELLQHGGTKVSAE